MKNRKLKSALQAVVLYGYSVLPLHWAKKGRCSCSDPECSSVGKHPLTPHGVKDATKDEITIRQWWREFPKANIGIATGKVSNLIVLDVDLPHGGMESLHQFENENGPLPEGPVARTGGGGLHFFFTRSTNTVVNKVGLLPGIDVRSDGGYVVYPGSIHKSGKRYRWLHNKSPRTVSPPPFPASLEEVKRAREHSSALESEPTISKGERNSTLASLAGAMRSRGMTHEAIEAALLQDNHLRCNPPLPDTEVCGIARSISRYGPGDPRILSAFSMNDEKAERKLRFRTGEQIANETPASVLWILPPWLALGAITEVDGKVKQAGKTTLLTYMVNAALNGFPFLGQNTSQTPVVYLTEQHLVSFRAAIERANLLGRRDFIVLPWTDTIGVSWPSVVHAAVDQCKKRGAKLLVIDTLPQFAGLVGDTENNAGDALKALRPLQQAAAEGLGVVIVRHERKSGGSVGDSGRGSSAFAGAVDIVVSVRKPEGNQPRNVRLIQTLSRFDAPEDLLIELTEEGYRALGAPGEAAKERQAVDVLSGIPKSKKNAATIEDLAGTTGKKRAHLQRLLDALAKDEKISRLGRLPTLPFQQSTTFLASCRFYHYDLLTYR
jgi:bifunctional DNA primase/polymerase-like protein/primase-like protein/AAA domain-containing protein